MATLRILIGAFACIYLIARAPALWSSRSFGTGSFNPVGPLYMLSGPMPAFVPPTLWAVTLVAGLLATAGWFWRVTGPVLAVGLLCLTTYRNSWGMLFHTENLLVLHCLALALAPAADSLRLRQASESALFRQERAERGDYGWVLVVLGALTVGTYLLAGVAKIKGAGMGWAEGEQLRSHIAYDVVRKLEFGGSTSPLGHWLVRERWLFAPLAWLTLAFEFGAPLALLSRRAALAWCLIAWGFHAGVLASMLIVFPYPLSGVAFASFFRTDKLLVVAGRRLPTRMLRWLNASTNTAQQPLA